MKVAVIGLWHLGCVTAACLAKLGHSVVAYDEAISRIVDLNNYRIPIDEPNLVEYINVGKQTNRLCFTNDPADISDVEIIWVTYDTHIDDRGRADIEAIKSRLIQLFPYFKQNALVIISSQIPVGTTQAIITIFNEIYPGKEVEFVYSPENLRLGQAVELFIQPDRIIMGISSEKVKKSIEALLQSMRDKLIWMTIESAEMTKHAINTFLATSIVFINELALLCEQLNVDVKAVEVGLKTDMRIGTKAYLSSGNAFSGVTLGRDINYLLKLSQDCQLPMDLIKAVLLSNQNHISWIRQKLNEKLKQLAGKKIAILGLGYKPGINCLEDSLMVNMSKWLHQSGAIIRAYDPAIKNLDADLELIIDLQKNLTSALDGADAIVIGAAWPELINSNAKQLIKEIQQAYVLDSNGFLSKQLEGEKCIDYYRVGISS
ncbi:MAG: nucleotide sugar dehydrogenase [Pseudomonadota bacterium]